MRLVPDTTTARRFGLKPKTAIGTLQATLAGRRKTTVQVKLNAARNVPIKRERVRSIRFAVQAIDAGKRPVAGGETLTVRRSHRGA